MMSERLQYLFRRYFDKTVSPEERDELMLLLNACSEEEVTDLMEEMYSCYTPAQDVFNSGNREVMLKTILKETPGPEKVVHLPVEPRGGNRKRWVVAAAISILAVIACSYFFLEKKESLPLVIAEPKSYENDVLPGGNKAALTLADGTVITLDNVADGTLAQQGHTQVLKLEDGQIAYHAGNTDPSDVLYNKLATPRGGQYRLTLPDGSLAWLNAASSIRYPTAFTGKERMVEITGEVYFEVAKNPAMPFKVIVPAGRPGEKDMEVTVLGTHFNIMAYADEAIIKTTLLEGAVTVSRGNASSSIKPGQQARMSRDNGSIYIARKANTKDAVAWKSGYFQFEEASINTIMNQVARWYDVEVVYKEAVTEKFSVLMLPRDLPVSRLLELLELTGNVHFKIEGRRVTVMP